MSNPMRTARLLLAVFGFALASAALAQAWPGRPVRIVVGFAAGSATDIIARVMAERFARTLGQPFIVENKPGAGGSVGAEQVKNAPADDFAARIGLMDRAARARRGTPAAIVDRVAADARVVLAVADTRDRLISQGAVPQAGTPAHLQALIDADSARYGRIIREKGLKVQ